MEAKGGGVLEICMRSATRDIIENLYMTEKHKHGLLMHRRHAKDLKT